MFWLLEIFRKSANGLLQFHRLVLLKKDTPQVKPLPARAHIWDLDDTHLFIEWLLASVLQAFPTLLNTSPPSCIMATSTSIWSTQMTNLSHMSRCSGTRNRCYRKCAS